MEPIESLRNSEWLSTLRCCRLLVLCFALLSFLLLKIFVNFLSEIQIFGQVVSFQRLKKCLLSRAANLLFGDVHKWAVLFVFEVFCPVTNAAAHLTSSSFSCSFLWDSSFAAVKKRLLKIKIKIKTI